MVSQGSEGEPIGAQTAGYSGRTLAQKLGLKEGHRLVVDGAPPGWTIADVPNDVTLREQLEAPFDVAVWFVQSIEALESGLDAAVRQLSARSSLWVAWPRRAGGHTSDVTEQAIRDRVLPLGLVDVKVAAIDNDWSGLKLVWRVSKRWDLDR